MCYFIYQGFFHGNPEHIFSLKSYAIFLKGFLGTLNFADMEDWNVAETEGRKVADTIFSKDGKLPTIFFSEGWKVADKTNIL